MTGPTPDVAKVLMDRLNDMLAAGELDDEIRAGLIQHFTLVVDYMDADGAERFAIILGPQDSTHVLYAHAKLLDKYADGHFWQWWNEWQGSEEP